MSIDLQHDGPYKFALAGIDLNVPVDLVPPTKYSRATNVVSKIEGRLETRDGITAITSVDPSPLHTIFRLTQFNPAVQGERLVGAGTTLYTAPLPAGNTFVPLTGGPEFDGQPLSIIQFRFDADPAVWAIIANANGMMKRRSGYYQLLGVAPPTVVATSTTGGAGLLDSSTGSSYDWRYTYLNEVTLSESNGSPIQPTITFPVVKDTLRPSANVNPDPVQDPIAVVFVNPTSAYDNDPTTFALGSVSGSQVATVLFKTFGAPTGAYSSNTLFIDSALTVTAVGSATHGGRIQYSLDGGLTWITVYFQQATRARQTDSIVLPNGQDMSKVQVRALVESSTPAAANMQIFEIYTTGVLLQPSSGGNLNLTNQSANVCVTPPTDPQETAIRLYRRGGTLPDNWFQVGQFPVSSLAQGSCGAGTLLINDNVPDSQAELGAILPQDNFQPIQSVQAVNFPLPIVFGPSDGRVLACGDPARPDVVYFSARGNADTWGAESWVVVANPGEQIMNGLVYNLRTFAFSRERLYIMLPNIIQGITFVCSETACRRGLKGRFGFTSGERGIYFYSKDGIYRTVGGPEESIIDDSIRPLFPTRESPTGTPTNGYDAVNLDDENGLRMTYHNGEIWCYYTGATTGLRQLMIFDERRSRWRPGTYTPQMQLAYSEPNVDSSLLYGGINGTLYAAGGDDDDGTAIAVDLTTGARDQDRPLNLKEYLNTVFDIDPGGATALSPITITPRINGETATELALTIIGTGRQRVPLPLTQPGGELYAYNLEYDISWVASAGMKPILYQYETLYRNEPAEVTHWELPRTSMGMEGWFHLRDMYIVLRSNSPVTLTVTPDVGVPQVFVLPSTGGLKTTVYVKLAASKSNSYAFSMDSGAPFRTYAEECEVRIKQWLTKLGYKNVPIIAREQIGKPFGLTNV